ncbi:putative colanic acid biosynthesis acetyltransferase WcaF [Pseudopedobacter saltans DSM 12145]|uniref:Colanic acid biosynthesis acetyltransferase WcaF n=1 Tax=Pseudopedobacter saltans (strain ATCC 51119 / DSM 12145 / JCM 21818 / CCUG 39354 / LMG 10337 / NBRC 100064 / NCIMB 13643) TaxID=762903 RepID=F0SD98_PSESL|nr:WcaF family extracellular polysaccharide biosynthesis acetyltransferase [Pseudopedobacter saltans]ADY52884.1 putative colanic acid biosynthesis acetyltransferase WcaF [Pseudopedobacter saltans DSM 12145]
MQNKVQLKKDFDTKEFDIGASLIKQLLWYFTSALFFRSGIIPFSSVLVFILRCFGAKIGKDVRIKPFIHIKYPWKLEMGNHSWLAECYIENLDWVRIGENCCISQGAMLLTGNHNYKSTKFDLAISPITLEGGVWIGAKATVCPGVICHSHAVLSVGSVATKNMDAYSIYQGNPAVKVRERVIG